MRSAVMQCKFFMAKIAAYNHVITALQEQLTWNMTACIRVHFKKVQKNGINRPMRWSVIACLCPMAE